jgi:hypothetical protein
MSFISTVARSFLRLALRRVPSRARFAMALRASWGCSTSLAGQSVAAVPRVFGTGTREGGEEHETRRSRRNASRLHASRRSRLRDPVLYLLPGVQMSASLHRTNRPTNVRYPWRPPSLFHRWMDFRMRFGQAPDHETAKATKNAKHEDHEETRRAPNLRGLRASCASRRFAAS